MAACGFTQEAIARCLGTAGISEPTLREHFRTELDTAATLANATVGNKLYQMAVSGNPPAATFFWLKCRAGWKEVQPIEVSGPGGTPIDVNVSARDLLAARIAGIAARIAAPEADPEPE